MFIFSPVLRVSLALIIVIVAGMAFWFITTNVPSPAEMALGKVLTGGEAMVIQNISMLEKKDNRTTLRLNAQKASFSEDRKQIRLSNFSLMSFGDDSGVVTISAKDGVFNSGSKDILAEGGVLVMDEEGKALYSEELRWADQERVLTSEKPVRIFGGQFLIKGGKLVVEMESGRARLSGGVTAIFQKN